MKKKHHSANWHQKHFQKLDFGEKIADQVTRFLGSWKFILWQTFFVILWLAVNVIGLAYRWDPFPFILLNLIFSIQAAYTAPIIMMAQNRQAERDRVHAEADFATNLQAKKEIDEIQKELTKIRQQDLNKIILLLEEIQKKIR